MNHPHLFTAAAFSTVLRHYNKITPCYLTGKQLAVLLTVSMLGGLPGTYISISSIWRLGQSKVFQLDYAKAHDYCKYLFQSGYLDQHQQQKGKVTFSGYSLTIAGMNLLNEIEHKLKTAKKVKK